MDVQEFREQIEKAKAICPLCAHSAYELSGHLMEKHKLSIPNFQKKFPGVPFQSPILEEINSRLGRKPIHGKRADSDISGFLQSFSGGTSTYLAVKELASKTAPFLAPIDPKNVSLVPKEDPNFRFDMDSVKAILAAQAIQRNAFIEGPTGCGKTQLVCQLFAVMKRPVQRVNMNGEITPATFIGRMKAGPQGTYFDEGALPKAMKGGYTLLLDEVDYAPPHVIASVHSALEPGHTLFIPEINEVVHAARGFNVIATANTGGKGDRHGVYTGTEILNTAFLDRFGVKLKMDYLSVKEEIAMLCNRFPNEPKGDVEEMVALATEVRDGFKRGQFALTFSSRRLIDYFDLKCTVGPDGALYLALINWADEDDKQLIIELLARVRKTPVKAKAKVPF